MALALFDLDNTLIAGDSDYLWGCFLAEKGLVDRYTYEEANLRFYEDYKKGVLDIHEFLSFALAPLADNDIALLHILHEEFMEKQVQPIMTETGKQKIAEHQQRGDHLVIITATNSFVTAPIARAFGVDTLIATEPEVIDGLYTGHVDGIPCFQDGKITKLEAWLKDNHHDLSGSTFYSDSHNDLPLLEKVDRAVAVDPDEQLRAIAAERNWEIVSFR